MKLSMLVGLGQEWSRTEMSKGVGMALAVPERMKSGQIRQIPTKG
jgi:hypothetical protein